MKAQRHLGS